MFKVKQDSLGDVILLTSQGVSFPELQGGLKVTREACCLLLACWLACSSELTPWSLFMTHAQAVTLAQNHEHTLKRKLLIFCPR